MILSDKQSIPRGRAFTLIEIMVVVAIIAIAAFLAVPMFSSAADVQLRSAANMIAADIEYAKSLAITRQQPHSVVFYTVDHRYTVVDESGTAVAHPLNRGGKLDVRFPSDSRLKKVTIASAEFEPGAETTVTFNYLGSPCPGMTTASPLVSGAVKLSAEGMTMTITIEPVTGYVTVN